MAIVYRSGEISLESIRSRISYRIAEFYIRTTMLSQCGYFFVALELFDYVCTFAFLTVSPSCKYYASFTRTASSVFDEEAI